MINTAGIYTPFASTWVRIPLVLFLVGSVLVIFLVSVCYVVFSFCLFFFWLVFPMLPMPVDCHYWMSFRYLQRFSMMEVVTCSIFNSQIDVLMFIVIVYTVCCYILPTTSALLFLFAIFHLGDSVYNMKSIKPLD